MALNAHQRGPAVILVGAQGCGKTSLINRFTEHTFNENCLATLGIDVMFLGEQICELKPSLWDASGHQRFGHIVRGYLGGARAALLVYDVANRATLESTAAEWLAALREEAPADLIVLLVGTKTDCLSESRQVSPEEAAAFVARHGLHGCLEASAKTGEGVTETFEELFELLRARERPRLQQQRQQQQQSAASAEGHHQSEEPLILGRRLGDAGAALGGQQGGKPGQWTLGSCFSAIGHLLCRRPQNWRGGQSV